MIDLGRSTEVLNTSEWDGNGNKGRIGQMPLGEGSWIIPAERCVTFDETRMLGWVERYESEYEVATEDRVTEHSWAAEANAKYEWDL